MRRERLGHQRGIDFNTKKVRLKPEQDRLYEDLRSRFQYQKGAIKTQGREDEIGRTGAFQYQKGAIKTVQQDFDQPPVRSFQYQKGAIKTVTLTSFMMHLRYFNTKKVRLKPRRAGGASSSTTISIPKRCD